MTKNAQTPPTALADDTLDKLSVVGGHTGSLPGTATIMVRTNDGYGYSLSKQPESHLSGHAKD